MKRNELSVELFSIKGPSALTQMLEPHWENKECAQRLRGRGQEKHEGHEEWGSSSLLPCTGGPRSGITLYSSSDIFIYELRMHWSPTAKIDLVVHLIQLMSEFENNYDSGADSQAITFLFSRSPAPSPSLPPTPIPLPLRLFLREGNGGTGQGSSFWRSGIWTPTAQTIINSILSCLVPYLNQIF